MKFVVVFIGGGVGSMLRYAMSRAVLATAPRAYFPWATLAANTMSILLMAYCLYRWQGFLLGRHLLHAFLVVGVCGGLSTFSAFAQENHILLRNGMWGYAGVNISISIIAGIGLFHYFARST